MSEYIIRKAVSGDLPVLRGLYLVLEEDGVRYQPEHFVIGERTDEFFQVIFDKERINTNLIDNLYKIWYYLV